MLRFGSRCSSALGTTNSALPQSKQTISSEYTKTACLSMFSSPERRMPVSALNSSRLADPQDLQSIYPLRLSNFTPLEITSIYNLPILSRLDMLRQTHHSDVDHRQVQKGQPKHFHYR